MLEKVYLYHLERSKLKLHRIFFLMLWRFSWILHECLIHECKIICLANILNNYLLFATSSSNTYTKAFIEIDRARKWLVDEVSPKICKFMYLKLACLISVLTDTNFSQIVSCLMIGLSSKQVLQVVKKIKSLKRFSFLAHSLGGLFARCWNYNIVWVVVPTKNSY